MDWWMDGRTEWNGKELHHHDTDGVKVTLCFVFFQFIGVRDGGGVGGTIDLCGGLKMRRLVTEDMDRGSSRSNHLPVKEVHAKD